MKITHTIEIRSTPEKVFYWLGDPDRAKKWMTSVTETEILKKTPNMVGTTFREIIEDNGLRTELNGSVTSYIPNKELSFHLTSKLNSVDVTFSLEKSGEITRLTQNVDIQFKALLRTISVFTGRLIKKKIIDQSQREFMNLKELCEQKDLDDIRD